MCSKNALRRKCDKGVRNSSKKRRQKCETGNSHLTSTIKPKKSSSPRKYETVATGTISSVRAVKQIPIDQLKPNPENPRVNDMAVDVVARSIQAYGFNNPIITDGDLNIAAGHTRLKAAKKLGMAAVPVIRVPGLTGSKFTGFAIADNKTGEIAEWDQEILQKLVTELNHDKDFNLDALGFNDAELSRLLDQGFNLDLEKEDDAPALPEQSTTKPGDLWILGDHRLLCGDATNIQDVHRLTAEYAIDCLLTDPPYGVNYSSRGRRKDEWGSIENDNLDEEHLELFLTTAFKNAAGVSRSGATGYIFHGISKAGIRIAFERAFLSAGYQLGSTIIWMKPSASMGWGDYREQHEPILYGWRGNGHRRIKDRTQTTIWQIDRDGDYRHPTQKPVAIMSRALRNSTVRGEIVFDPFVGSGTTIIACEQIGRRCLAMEIDSKFCDVVVKRWEAYTGKKARICQGGVARKEA